MITTMAIRPSVSRCGRLSHTVSQGGVRAAQLRRLARATQRRGRCYFQLPSPHDPPSRLQLPAKVTESNNVPSLSPPCPLLASRLARCHHRRPFMRVESDTLVIGGGI